MLHLQILWTLVDVPVLDVYRDRMKHHRVYEVTELVPTLFRQADVRMV
jgi:hypothetical protein